MVEQAHRDLRQPKPRRPKDYLAAPRACRRGEHNPVSTITVDAAGVEHSRCRTCGCELARMPVIRRWYRTGLLGE